MVEYMEMPVRHAGLPALNMSCTRIGSGRDFASLDKKIRGVRQHWCDMSIYGDVRDSLGLPYIVLSSLP